MHGETTSCPCPPSPAASPTCLPQRDTNRHSKNGGLWYVRTQGGAKNREHTGADGGNSVLSAGKQLHYPSEPSLTLSLKHRRLSEAPEPALPNLFQ